MMSQLSRRHLLGLGGLAAAAATGALVGCDNSQAAGPDGDGGGTIKWWDQFLPKEELNKRMFAKFHEQGGPEVEHTVYNPNQQGKALQLAKQSNQMPDVFTLAGLESSGAALHDAAWFAPLSTADEIRTSFPEGTLIDGVHIFDGELYSFPLTSFRNYVTLPWGSKPLLEKAGIEANDGPQSLDDFRATVRQSQERTGKPGLILPLSFAPRMGNFVDELAQGAGFPGMGGTELATGEFNFHHDTYVDAIDWLLSFQKDKLLLSASTGMDARQGRARWASGAAVWFMDGSFCAGVCQSDFPQMMDNLVVTQMPTPDGEAPVITNGPGGGALWVSKSSAHVEECGTLLALFASDEYMIGQAEAMDAAPFDLSAVPDSKAHPTFKTCCKWFEDCAYLGPSAVARTTDINKVTAKHKTVKPDLGTIVQGVFSGDVSDVRSALKKLSDDEERAREAAIKAAGVKLDGSAWAFPDWKPGEDYVTKTG